MPYRSASSPADVGLSKEEYEDAVNLEKLYFLSNKNDRCANCGRGGVSAVDVSRYEFLCSSCCSGKSSVKKIGEDRFSSFEVNKLYARFDRSSTHRGRGSASPIRRGSSGGGSRRNDRRSDRRSSRRAAPPDFSDNSDSDSGDESPPPPRRSRSVPRASSGRSPRHASHRSSAHRGDPFDDFDAASEASWGGTGSAQGLSSSPSSWGPVFGAGAPAARAQMSPSGALGAAGGMGPNSPAGMLGLTPSPMATQATFNQGLQYPGMMGNPMFMGNAVASQAGPRGPQAPGAWGASQSPAFLAQQQYQQALLRQQQFAATAAGRGAGGGMFRGPGTPNLVGQASGFMVAGGGAAGPFRPGVSPPFAQQQANARATNPFLSMGAGVQAQPQAMGQGGMMAAFPNAQAAGGGAGMNPFLQQNAALCGAGGAGMFGDRTGVAGFSQPQAAQMSSQFGGGASVMMGGATPAGANPFTSMGAAPQRPVALMNGVAPGGGVGANPYSSSLW
ncbi:hypothetical protein BESB_077370 [Besnoitia besnoiti]|uniref:Major ampullate spidroin 2 n=1 Tax=Besnoitia besnoiti TaxID=94643 RepID=A0A2A9MDQ7_BESBE|nr:hypothetical protein BESB_077370 [Besnoitia besnoiti]PFH33520.1 hypothetical protein BESB_077370 [Besnoitia besnoiti]